MSRAGVATALCGRLFVAALGISLAACSPPSDEPHGERFGLLSSLPIYRAPQASVADALAQREGAPHWLRAAVEANNTLEPLDVLDAASLARTDTLLLIQPRALTPAEYVTLDQWVRDGGRVLLATDPMLESEPAFALGDPRNPQAISLTGPIEARWGLALEFPSAQSGISGDGAEQVVIDGHEVPVAFGGRFTKMPPAGGDSADCTLRTAGLVAVCSIGKGHAVLIADATLFERDAVSEDGRAAFWSLVGTSGDDLGS